MSSESQTKLVKGQHHHHLVTDEIQVSCGSKVVQEHDAELAASLPNSQFHGDTSLADEHIETTSKWSDVGKVVLPPQNWWSIGEVLKKYFSTNPHELDVRDSPLGVLFHLLIKITD